MARFFRTRRRRRQMLWWSFRLPWPLSCWSIDPDCPSRTVWSERELEREREMVQDVLKVPGDGLPDGSRWDTRTVMAMMEKGGRRTRHSTVLIFVRRRTQQLSHWLVLMDRNQRPRIKRLVKYRKQLSGVTWASAIAQRLKYPQGAFYCFGENKINIIIIIIPEKKREREKKKKKEKKKSVEVS